MNHSLTQSGTLVDGQCNCAPHLALHGTFSQNGKHWQLPLVQPNLARRIRKRLYICFFVLLTVYQTYWLREVRKTARIGLCTILIQSLLTPPF